MIIAEFVLGLAFAHKQWRGADCALLLSSDGVVKYIGEQSRTYTYDTPVVNLLQNLGVAKTGGAILVCSYEPNEMDLGMGCMRKVAYALFVKAGVVQIVPLSDESGVGLGQAPWGPWRSRAEFNFGPRDRKPFKDSMEKPWDDKVPWVNPAWATAWYGRLDGDRQLTRGDAFTFFDSYRKVATQPAYTTRPVAVISTAQNTLTTGLVEVTGFSGALLSPALSDKLFMGTAMAIVGRSLTRPSTVSGGHNIGAVMTDHMGKIIGWGLNLSDLNGTFHAETAMVLTYLRRNNTTTLPENCTIYTTLKPCHMCAGFIAHVAKGAKVVYGQNDPKITHSALDDNRGVNTSQRASTMPVSTDLLPPRPNMTVAEALSELITRSGLNAVPFLYSSVAENFFGALRRNPRLFQAAVKRFSEAPSTTQTVGIRPLGPQPPISLNAVRGRVTQLSPSANALDLAPSLSNLQIRGGANVPLGQPMTNTLKGMQVSGLFEYGLVDPSRTLEGLDLALGHTDPIQRKKVADTGAQTLEPLLKTMSQIELFLRTLRRKNLLTSD